MPHDLRIWMQLEAQVNFATKTYENTMRGAKFTKVKGNGDCLLTRNAPKAKVV